MSAALITPEKLESSATLLFEANDGTAGNPHRWTRDEFHRMAASGLFDDLRVELLDGRIWDTRPSANCPQ